MLSNDILRSLRYTLKANNNDMVRILALSDMESTSAGFDTWMTKEDEEGFVRCPDIILSGFLNGLIYDKRGKDESAPEMALERRVNNNTVLKKLRIAALAENGRYCGDHDGAKIPRIRAGSDCHDARAGPQKLPRVRRSVSA